MQKKFLILFLLTAVALWGIGSTCQARILSPHGMGQIGLQAVVLCESLTVREGRSASSGTVQTLQYGDLVIVTEQSDGWAFCVLGDSEDSAAGWVNSDYIIIDPAWYRTDGTVPVYAWDDMTAPKVALLSEDTTLPILKDEGDWLIVSLRGASGWIHKNAADRAYLQ